MPKYQNQHKRNPIRQTSWEFGPAGAARMKLSSAGKIGSSIGAELGAFIVMPNHVHGILILAHRFNGG